MNYGRPHQTEAQSNVAARPAVPYPDLHDHVRALDRAGLLIRSTARSTRTPRCTRWCAGSSAAASRRRTARRSCSPTSSTARAANTTSRCWSAGSPPTARSIASASAARSRRSTRAGSRRRAIRSRRASSTNAPCHEIVITGKELDKPGNGPRRHSAADLDAGLGHRALRDAVAVHHQGSRHRRPEHGQLPRPGEGAAAARHEPVARAAARHLQSLGKAARARLQEAAVRGGARRAALRHLRLGAEAARERSTSCTSPARWSARRSTW